MECKYKITGEKVGKLTAWRLFFWLNDGHLVADIGSILSGAELEA